MAERTGDMPNLPDAFEFHHLGYATRGIDREIEPLTLLGYRETGVRFADPVQGIAGCFVEGPGPRIELLENLPGSKTLTPWLDAGVKLYHFAYMVADLERALAWAATVRSRVVAPPVPATAFGGRRICFVMFRNGLLLELIERHLPESP